MLHIKSFVQCLLLGLAGLVLSACGGGSGGSSAPTTYTVGGNVTGLSGTVVLQLSGANNLSVTASGSFGFANGLNTGTAYAVTVLTQPTNQICTVTNGSGTVASANISNVAVGCVNTYTVGGNVSGLTAAGLVVQLNGAGNVSVASGATAFAFATALSSGQAFAVTINTQPTGLTCALANASGTIGSANVTNVAISCAPTTYTVTASISGLIANGLTLQLNANSSVAVASGATTYTFSNTLLTTQTYGVAILGQPTGLTCTLANGSGTIGSANVSNVAVNCIPTPTYIVTVNFTGLTASGLVLQLNSANNATIASGTTTYSFPTLLASQSYSVSILTQPTGLTCTPGISTGAGSSTNVSVAITCAATATTYTVGGAITGLNASGLVLALNVNGVLANTMSVASGATTFTFATPLNNAATYVVAVYVPNFSQFNQPTGQTCTLTSNSGTIASANKTNVAVTCVTNPNTTVSGTISGLTAAGLKLTLNGATSTGSLTQIEELTVASGASTFTFANTFTSVAGVTLRVSSQPAGLTCIIANAIGQVGTASLTTPQVQCATRTINTLTGTYQLSTQNSVSVDIAVFVTFYSDGSYVLTHNDQGPTTGPDAEYGIYNWNQSTGAFTVPVLAVDTNGPSQNDTGFGSLQSCCTVTLSRSGSTLTAVVIEGAVTETDTFTAITNVSGSLTGSWLQPNNGHGHDFVVFTGTTFMWSFTNILTSLNSTNNPAFYNGIENACYSATSSTISPTLSGCFVTTRLTGVNANGNPGFFNASGALNTNGIPTSYSISGDTMTWTYSNGNTQTLTRITN
jgi:hypothetical protein